MSGVSKAQEGGQVNPNLLPTRQQIDELTALVNQRFAQLAARMDERFNQIEAQLGEVTRLLGAAEKLEQLRRAGRALGGAA